MTEKKNDTEERRGLLIGGVITLGIGTLFLLSNLEVIPSIHEMWPLLPIIVGIALIVGALKKGKDSD